MVSDKIVPAVTKFCKSLGTIILVEFPFATSTIASKLLSFSTDSSAPASFKSVIPFAFASCIFIIA